VSSLARRSEVCFGRANRDAAAWPLAARAQQAGGYDRLAQCRCVRSHLTGAHGFSLMLCESWDGSKEKTCYRAPFRGESAERLPEFAAELVRLKVDVTVGIGTLAPLADKRATTTIPIVMTAAGDPLGCGLVASLARPGGNVTGMSLMSPDLGGNRLELLRELLPGLARVAVLWNAANPYAALVFKETQAAGRTLGIEVESLEVRSPGRLQWRIRYCTTRAPGCIDNGRRPSHLFAEPNKPSPGQRP